MIPRNYLFRLALCAIYFSVWLVTPPVTYAVNKNSDEPIHINARTVETNEKTGVAVYSGNVLVEQGRLSIKADRIELRTRNRKTDTIRATGKPVKLRQQPDEGTEEIQAEASRVDYHVSDRKLDMFGNVTVRRGEDLFTGSVLHYDLDAKNLTAMGDDKSDGRVHAVIQPRKQTAEPISNNDAVSRPKELNQ